MAIPLTSPAHDLHDPHHGLQQRHMLHLDELAAGLDQLGGSPGRPAVVDSCADPSCPLPEFPASQVVRSIDPKRAQQCALRTAAGRGGPGYAVVDASGRLRCRTFDPGLPQPLGHLGGPCRDETPLLQAAHVRHGDRVQSLGVNAQDTTDAAVAFLPDVGVTHPRSATSTGTFSTTCAPPACPSPSRSTPTATSPPGTSAS